MFPEFLPPNSVEAEQAVLGAAMISQKAAAWMLSELKEEMFYLTEHHAPIYRVFREDGLKTRLDSFTVEEALRKRGLLEMVGGVTYIRTLVESVPTAAHVAYYGNIVREKFRLRRIAEVTARYRERALWEEAPAEELEQNLVRELLQVEQAGNRDLVSFKDAVLAERARLEAGEADPVLLSGMQSIDAVAGGLGRQEIGLICGRPGSGKSCAGMQQAFEAANEWGPTLFVSLEMKAEALARRALAGMTGYSFRSLRDGLMYDSFGRVLGPLSEAELEGVRQACEMLTNTTYPLWILRGAHRLSRLIYQAHRYRIEHDIQAIVIDYGQLLHADGKFGNRAEETAYIARALKEELADPLDVPVWVLAQPNREVEKREREGKPSRLKMSDLGWSAEWEQVASQIWFLNADPEESGRPDCRNLLLEIGKSRNGAQGVTVPLVFECARFRFQERARFHSDEDAPPERRWS